MIEQNLREVFEKVLQGTKKKKKKVTFLTGAGISAESGIPTYRGSEGYWVKGSANYRPEEIGTYRFFTGHPKVVWQFVLFRKGIFQQACPNAGHYAIANLEKLLGNRFHLITQNIDRLHFRAGNSEERTYEIHGNQEKLRCGIECSQELYPFPEIVKPKKTGEAITDEEWKALKCPNCGFFLRPNIL